MGIKKTNLTVSSYVKRCARCGLEKSRHEFSAHRKNTTDGLCSYCKSCNAISVSEWKAKNPDKVRTNNLKRYSITPQQYDDMLAAQDGRCAICQAVPGARALSVDHDHSCCPGKQKSCGGCVRGLLCQTCNMLLGATEDSVERLASAIVYLLDREG